MRRPSPPPAHPTRARRGASLVAAGIFLSRLTGLLREKALGYFLGAGLAVDAFRAAFKIPNLLQNLLGEGVLSASFIPVYSRLLAEEREEEAGQVAGAVAGLLATVAGVLVVVGVVFARPVTMVLVPGFDGLRLDLTVRLVRILTPGVGFLVLSAWCLGVLNSHRRFFLSYVAPVVWNAVMIAVLVTLGLRGLGDVPIALGLAWGALAGGALQFAVQLPAVLRLSPGLRPSLRVDLPGVRRVLRAFGPIVSGRGVVQLSGYVDILLASFLAAGAVAVLGYAQVLYMLPISLFGMSVAAAELPELSSQRSEEIGVVVERIEAGLERIAFFVIPTVVVYLVLGGVVVGALYQGGEFGRDETVQVWAVLTAYTIGLFASTASRLLQSALYGAGDARTPAAVSAARVVVSALLGAALMLQLDRVELTSAGVNLLGDLPAVAPLPAPVRNAGESLHRLGAAGLALGTGVSAWLEYALLRRAVVRRFGPVRLYGGMLAGLLLAAVVAALVGLGVRTLFGGLHPLLTAAVVLVPAGLSYLGLAVALGSDEAKALARALRIRRRH